MALLTAKEKTSLRDFLDLAGDYLKDGYRRDREDTVFGDDVDSEGAAGSRAEQGGAPEAGNASLPLAYLVEEPGEEYTNRNAADSPDFADSPEKIAAEIAACKACGLCATRTLAVPGEGSSRPLVMVVGEGPGADEDRSGRPFVGKAGQLLDKMLESIGLFRNKNCFIANMVKCRPPENRDPAPDEIAACFPFLERQISLLRPKVILCAGRVAAQNLLKTGMGINALRGEFAEFTPGPAVKPEAGKIVIPVLCTFHPSALLRDESLKRPAWEDLKLLRSRLPAQSDDR